MSKTFSQADVASHNKPNDLYITIDDDVYDLTQFQDEHPGMRSLSNQFLFQRNLSLTQHRRRQEDPHPGRRQRRLEAILEVPQRRYPQEVQIEAPCRLPRQQESLRAAHTTRDTASIRREAGDREAEG